MSPRQPGSTPTRTRDPSGLGIGSNPRSPRPDSSRPEDLQQQQQSSGCVIIE